MSLNLHATVRQAIQSVNRDITAVYLASTGYAANSAGKQVPGYASPVNVQVQSQPPSGRDLKHMEFLNIQGTTRVLYVYSDPNAIRRVDIKGGDLFQFRSFVGAPLDNWLVAHVDETWSVGQNGLITFDGVGSVASSSDVLTIASVTSGFLNIGDVIGDSLGAVPPDTAIEAFVSGTPGSAGVYMMTREATATQNPDMFIVTDSAAESGWTKLFAVLQTDRPVQPS